MAEPGTEPRYGWPVVWDGFTAPALIFGLSYPFAATAPLPTVPTAQEPGMLELEALG